jgi:hypothetical protein
VTSDVVVLSVRKAKTMQWNRFLPSAVPRLLVVSVLTVLPVFSQTQTRLIAWPKTSPYNSKAMAAPDPQVKSRIDEIEIAGIVVEGQQIQVGEPFSASDDWLRNIGFRIRNISDKQLAKIQITLVLPEIRSGSPQIPFCYGCDPIEKQKGIKPGEEVQLTMPGSGLYSWVQSTIAEKGISRISKAEFLAVYLTLADGTVWVSGCAKTADPKNACPSPSP